MRLLFTIILFVSSGLLFWVEPMFSKMVLPLLGGVPAVWNTCVVFYQATLLAGYLYAHLTSRCLHVRYQAILHIVLTWFALFTISFNLDKVPPNPNSPILSLFRMFFLSIGFPFLMLSATTPMLQRWFSQTNHPDAKNPYFLYAASNVGSLLALLGYPVLIEPFLRLNTQTWAWIVAYGMFALLLSGSAAGVWYHSNSPLEGGPGGFFNPPLLPSQEGNTPLYPPQGGNTSLSPLTAGIYPPVPLNGGIQQRLHWLMLAFVPSSLLLGVTSHITTDIAPIPLFWVIPLSLYLLTFVCVFARKPVFQHEGILKAQTYLVLPSLLLYLGNLNVEIWVDSPVHLTAFFVFAMVCHGELVKSKPPPERLTEFYLWMATGGVLGGIFTALIAPVIFNSIVEYPLMIVLACVMRPPTRFTIQRKQIRALLIALFAGLVLLPVGLLTGNQTVALYIGTISLILVASFGGAFCFYFLNTPKRITLGLGSFLLAGALLTSVQQDVLGRERSFFSTLKVSKDRGGECYLFYHGTTLQGAQYIAPGRRRDALTYFHREGPIGQIFAMFEKKSSRSIAIFGLGVGTLATYARPGDEVTFYEIDAAVEKFARETKWFTYLRDCLGKVRVVLGDARISLSYETDQRYDMIIQDAFSSDTVPVHLLTREAFQLYETTLTDTGILVFNITNRYLNLEPVLANLIQDAGMIGLIRRDMEQSGEDNKTKKFPSNWVVAARTRKELIKLQNDPRWQSLTIHPGIEVWTDDYSNVLSVLKFPDFLENNKDRIE